MRSIEEQSDRGVELLKLCLKMQCEKDGVNRPEVFEIDKSKTLDQFRMDISEAVVNMTALKQLLPMMLKLSEIGRNLEKAEKIKVDYGDDYAEAALTFLTAEFNTTTSTAK
jgi:hypothetical protein